MGTNCEVPQISMCTVSSKLARTGETSLLRWVFRQEVTYFRRLWTISETSSDRNNVFGFGTVHIQNSRVKGKRGYEVLSVVWDRTILIRIFYIDTSFLSSYFLFRSKLVEWLVTFGRSESFFVSGFFPEVLFHRIDVYSVSSFHPINVTETDKL